MKYRIFGRLGWEVSEIGHGTWGMGSGPSGWTGSSDEEAIAALNESIKLGCNFIDTAWIYGRGHSEELISEVLKTIATNKIYIATKVPPKNMQWPSKRGYLLEDVFPANHIYDYVNRSLENLKVNQIDLFQFHVWEDEWSENEKWMKVIDDLKSRKLINGVGISVNTWEPWNVLKTLDTNLIDSVQVIYNIFEQSPEDELFVKCREKNIAIIARVPFDEGSLIGNLTIDSKWEEGDWRNSYFVKENLIQTVKRVDDLKKVLPDGFTLAELALKFILSNKDISTVIPGMRKLSNVRNNIKCSDESRLPLSLMNILRQHRWDRQPTDWSQ